MLPGAIHCSSSIAQIAERTFQPQAVSGIHLNYKTGLTTATTCLKVFSFPYLPQTLLISLSVLFIVHT